MRVRATQAFAAVRDCQIIELTAGQEVDGDVAVYLLNTGAAVELVDDASPEPGVVSLRQTREDLGYTAEQIHLMEEEDRRVVDQQPDPDEAATGQLDIAGKIEDVLAWVGDDTDRALAALEAEEAKGDKARPRLVAKLNEI